MSIAFASTVYISTISHIVNGDSLFFFLKKKTLMNNNVFLALQTSEAALIDRFLGCLRHVIIIK